MPFPIGNPSWREALAFLERHLAPLAPLLAPNDFMEHLPGCYDYDVAGTLPPEHFDLVALHKGRAREIPLAFLREVTGRLTPVFANAEFVIYARQPIEPPQQVLRTYVRPLLREIAAMAAASDGPGPATGCASVITTFDRPASLRRTLPQVVALGAPVLIVDDGSADANATENRRVADELDVPLLRIPRNRGLCNALNSGIAYWLADPGVEWISTFQDDVDVHPELFKVLERVQDRRARPILAGHDAREHPNVATGAIAGYAVLYKRSMPGQHLHAHRDYWAGVLPIPTAYLGAPKAAGRRPGQGSNADWWITSWSPHSITKRGGHVVCVPGLVRTFQPHGEGSTWGNASVRDVDGLPREEAALPELAPPATDDVEPWVPVSPPA